MNITVTLPDGSAKEYPAGVTARTIAEDIGPGLAQNAIAALVDGEPFDLSRGIKKSADVKILTPKDDETLEIFRHSSAHLLAAAVTELFPNAQYGIGPPIDGGFFYDFVVDEPFTPDDLQKIEDRMKELARHKVPFEREEIPKSEAIAKFQELGQSFKKELVHEKGDDIVSCYRLGRFTIFAKARTCRIAVSSRRSQSSRARRLIGRATRPTRPCSASTRRRSTTKRPSPSI